MSADVNEAILLVDMTDDHARLQRIVTIAQLAHEWAKARRLVGEIGLRASRQETEKLWAASDRLEVACLGPREKKGPPRE